MLSNWVRTVHCDYFAPLWKRIKEELPKISVIHCNETAIQVLKEHGCLQL